jgi:hypothetical protein
MQEEATMAKPTFRKLLHQLKEIEANDSTRLDQVVMINLSETIDDIVLVSDADGRLIFNINWED